MLEPSGEKLMLATTLMPVSISPFESRVSASKPSKVSAENVTKCDFRADAPASQTLSFFSLEPETMVLPSGEKTAENTAPQCALHFSALSSREAAAGRGISVFALRVQGYQCPRTRIPDFERPSVGARHDGLTIGGEGHGVYPGLENLLLCLQLQRCCNRQGSHQFWAQVLGDANQCPRTRIPDFGWFEGPNVHLLC